MMKSDLNRSWVFILEIFLKSVTCRDSWSLGEWGLQKKVRKFPHVRWLWKRIFILFRFPCSTLSSNLKWETKPTIHHYSWLLTIDFFFFYILHNLFLHSFLSISFTYFSLSLFFYLINTGRQLYKCTVVQKILKIFYLD